MTRSGLGFVRDPEHRAVVTCLGLDNDLGPLVDIGDLGKLGFVACCQLEVGGRAFLDSCISLACRIMPTPRTAGQVLQAARARPAVPIRSRKLVL
jgi:hypothetical protein